MICFLDLELEQENDHDILYYNLIINKPQTMHKTL